MAIRPETLDFLKEHAEKVASEATSILSMVTNKTVEFSFDSAEEFNFETLSGNYAESVVDASFVLSADPEGLFDIFVEKETAALVGSLMMMMEEENPVFEEDHIDAIQETVNQVLGSISTSLSESLGFSISFDNIKAEESELKEENFSKPDLIAVKFMLKIGEGDARPLNTVLTASSIDVVMGVGGEEATEAEASDEASDEASEEASDETEDLGGDLSEDELSDIGDALGLDMNDLPDSSEPDIGGSPDSDIEDMSIPAPSAAAMQMPTGHGQEVQKIDFLLDLKFGVSIELGRTKMLIKDILDLGHGSVIEFDKLANDPVDLLIDEKKIAEGEVVVIDEHFGIRITNLTHTGAALLKSVS